MADENINTQGAVTEGATAGSQTGQTSGQGTQGEGTTTTTPDYAGYKTPEELATAYQTKISELENLSRLQGRQTNELGELRAKAARLEGMIHGIQTARPSAPAVTMADLDAKLQANDITLPDYLRQRDAIREREIEQKVEQKIGTLQTQTQLEKYREQFIKDNPGYVDAYNKGQLDEWINRGYAAEEAWTQYQLRQTATERDTLKKQLEEKTNLARQEGIQTGTKIEQGKTAAGKVLGEGGGGSFGLAGSGAKPLRTHSERVQAAVDLISKVQ